MRQAKKQGADVIHFPECSLSGYAGTDFTSYRGFDWALLKESTLKVLKEARELRLWTILGSTHRLSTGKKPHNSLYIISEARNIVERYDKLFCAGPKNGSTGDLSHYSSGNHFSTFTIKGVKCGTLICHDCRYPELYRQYKKRNVQVMFHSFHAGNISARKWHSMGKEIGEKYCKLNGASTLPGIVFPATIQSMAANCFMWISCSNSSAKFSAFPAFFVRPDGVMTGRLRINQAGILMSTVDTAARLYDSTVAWRERAINGVYYSGRRNRREKEALRDAFF